MPPSSSLQAAVLNAFFPITSAKKPLYLQALAATQVMFSCCINVSLAGEKIKS